jgi:hypothetical protein
MYQRGLRQLVEAKYLPSIQGMGRETKKFFNEGKPYSYYGVYIGAASPTSHLRPSTFYSSSHCSRPMGFAPRAKQTTPSPIFP